MEGIFKPQPPASWISASTVVIIMAVILIGSLLGNISSGKMQPIIKRK